MPSGLRVGLHQVILVMNGGAKVVGLLPVCVPLMRSGYVSPLPSRPIHHCDTSVSTPEILPCTPCVTHATEPA